MVYFSGVSVVVASVEESLTVKLAHGILVTADKNIKEVAENDNFDVIIIPGGKRYVDNTDMYIYVYYILCIYMYIWRQ